MLITKDEIWNSDDLKSELVDVSEWKEGAEIRMTEWSSFLRDRFEASCIGKNGGENLVNIRARMVAACATDENGELLFNEKEVVILGTKSGKIVNRLYEAAQRLNNYTDSDVDELAKN